MMQKALILALLTSLVTLSSQFKNFWKSQELGVNVIDGAFGEGKRPKILGQIVKKFNEINWAFTVDRSANNQFASTFSSGFQSKGNRMMKKAKIVNKLQQTAKALYDRNSSTSVVTWAEGRIIERGDFDPVVKRCFSNSSEIRAVVILTRKWKKNNYGEVTVYDKNEEVVKSIHPRYGRVIFLPCGVHFKISPPSINVEMRHYVFMAEFGSKLEKTKHPYSEHQSLSSYFEKNNIVFDSSWEETIVPEKFVKRKSQTSKGRRMYVFDNAVPLSIVDATRDFVANHADYNESPVHEEDSADNVKWIIAFDDPEFTANPLWHILKKLLIYTAGKEYYPYDITCNHIRRTDSTTIHKDIYSNEGEYTILLYLNRNYTENDYGETSFFENQEMIAAVRPKYGRVLIFDGHIDHCAHPTSPKFPGARYTLALKTAPTIRLAMERWLENDGKKLSTIEGKLKKLERTGKPARKEWAKKILKKINDGTLTNEDIAELMQIP